MALMQKPSDLDPEDTTEAQAMVALAEDGDVEEENLQYSGVAGFVEDQFRKAKDDRQTEEERWLTAYRNYRGIYGPEMQFTDTEKSKAFIKITKAKVLPLLRKSLMFCTPVPSFRSVLNPEISQQTLQMP